MKNIYITWHNEWKQIGKDFGWYTFSPLILSFEWDKSSGGVELCIVILGLGGTLRYNYDFENSPTGKKVEEYTEWTNEELEKKIDEILEVGSDGILRIHKSDCCGAWVRTVHADEGTSYWACDKCGLACNLKVGRKI